MRLAKKNFILDEIGLIVRKYLNNVFSIRLYLNFEGHSDESLTHMFK